jgi:hypothetical protein
LAHLIKSLSRLEVTILVVIVVYSFIPTFGGLFRVAELTGVAPTITPENPRALAEPLPFVVHVIASFIFCNLGALQFLPTVRRIRSDVHRTNGRAVAAAGIVAAATGLWMTVGYVFPSDLQGGLLYWVRVVLSISMMALIAWAVIAVQSKKILQHSAAMLRAYAIGQGASTQAFFGIGWLVVTGSDATGLFRDWLMVSCWVVNLLVAEVLISGRLKRNPIFRRSVAS